MGNLNRIVNVSIDIKTPAVSASGFDHLLIIGPAPTATPADAPLPVGSYNDLEGVTEAGWATVGENADPVGIAARVAFSQNPSPAKLYIAVQQTGEEGEIESIETTLNRALTISGWYAVCPAGIDESQLETIAAWTEAQTKLFAFTYVGETCPVGEIYYRSIGFDGKTEDKQLPEDVPAANLYLHVAAVAKCFSYSAGSETWAFKQLASVTPGSFSSTKMDELEAGHINYCAEYGGRNITMNGQTMAGEWIDVIRFRDWLQNDMQFRLYNLLLMNPKIPYTNSGLALVENQIIASCKAGQTVGGIALDEYDGDGALVPGFTVTIPNSQDLSASQKASRVLTGVSFSARLAGAIHIITVNGDLTY